MTTIATDGKTMAGDGRISAGDERLSDTTVKVHKLDDGRIVGISGCSYSAIELIRYMRDGGERPELSDDMHVLMLYTDGTVHLMNRRFVPVRVDVPNAIGSGADYAMGAMLAGATPEQAVQIAAQRDLFTGGKITVC